MKKKTLEKNKGLGDAQENTKACGNDKDNPRLGNLIQLGDRNTEEDSS